VNGNKQAGYMMAKRVHLIACFDRLATLSTTDAKVP
jgi:hypothetical protein